MLRVRPRPPISVPLGLFLAALALGSALKGLAHGTSDGLVFAAPLGLLWLAPSIWGRRAIWPSLAGSLLAMSVAQGSPALLVAGTICCATDLALGYRYSLYRRFPDGLNRIRDLVAVACAGSVPAAVRGLIVFAFAEHAEVERPLTLAFAAMALAWFANLAGAAVMLVHVGRWRIAWNRWRMAELAGLLAALGSLMIYLFANAGEKGTNYSYAFSVGQIILLIWLAIRFHIRGIGLHRLLWLALCSANLVQVGKFQSLFPLETDPLYCGQLALVLGALLFIELMIGAMASDRAIESESNAALTAELVARNRELETLGAADRERKAFLDSVLEQMPAGVMIVGTDGTILWRNKRHRDLWMETPSDGGSLSDLKRSRIAATKGLSVPFESWPIVKALTANVVTEDFEARILTPSRGAIDVSIGAAPVHGPTEELLGAVSILHDMTERKAAVRLLRDKEERLRFALQSARMIACEWSISTQQIQTSEPLSEWLGVSGTPLPGLGNLLKIVHPNDLALLKGVVGRFLGGGIECECEFRVPGAQGMLWIQYRGRRTTEDDGKPADRIAGILIDVSERRRSDERLRMLESAVVHARDGVVILESEPNRQPGRCVLYANDAFCEMTGYAAGELLGRSLHFLRGPDSDPATLERLREALDSGDPFKGELLNYRCDGSPFWVELSVVPVPDATGACAHWVMIQRDISGRKRVELDLRHSEAMLADAQRIAHVGSWEYFPKTGECRWSAEKMRIFGRDPVSFVPTVELYLEAVHPEDHERVLRAGTDARELIFPHSLDFRIVRPDGEIRFVSEEYYADFDPDGSPTRFWGVTLDGTEKKQSQEQLFQAQKMDLIGQMAGGIAHDFNNLLTGIIGNLHLIRMPDADGNRKPVEIALRAANRAADLTKKLLGFARKNQLVLSAVGVGDVVAEVVDFLGRTFDPRIRVSADIGADHRMLADSTLLSQVLLNLCLNARDAMPRGGSIEIRSAIVPGSDPTAGDSIRITVEDTGSGMAPEVLARIFEPFFTTKPVGQGTGLGLAMVHGIMTQHRGRVEVHSAVGSGTRFDLYLPRAEKGAVTALSHPAPASEFPLDRTPMPPSRRQKILLVDDEMMIRELGRAVLESGGYTVVEAEDGEVALAAFRAGSAEFDLVLLDLTMPKLSGQDTFRAMAAIDPRARVLFSSGYSSDDFAGIEGSCGLLPKPYRPQVLLEAVRRALTVSLPRPREGQPPPAMREWEEPAAFAGTCCDAVRSEP